MKVRIEFEAYLPQGGRATAAQIEEFLRFAYNDDGQISRLNPLAGCDAPEPIFGTFQWKEVIDSVTTD